MLIFLAVNVLNKHLEEEARRKAPTNKKVAYKAPAGKKKNKAPTAKKVGDDKAPAIKKVEDDEADYTIADGFEVSNCRCFLKHSL